MSSLRALWLRVRAMLPGGPRHRDLREEMQTHLDMLTQEHRDRGLSEREAQAAARRAFGGVHVAAERCRDQARLRWLAAAAQDIRFAIRIMMKDPRLTCGVVITLALGIGINTGVFTFFNAAYIQDVPLDHPEELVALTNHDARRLDVGASYRDYRAWKDTSRSFAAMTASVGGDMNLSDEDHAPERLRGYYVDADAFHLYGITAVAGRLFDAGDERPGAPPVVVFNDRVWRRRYNGDPGLIGRHVRVNGASAVVVGIIAADFKSPLMPWNNVLQPLQLAPALKTTGDQTKVGIVARLNEGTGLQEAQDEVAAIGRRLAREFPDTNRDLQPLVQGLKDSYTEITPFVVILLIASVLVLVVSCVNAANLLLSRAATRVREISIRASLGATRGRIVRQLLVETLVIAAMGGLLGLLAAEYFVHQFAFMFDGKEIGGDEFWRPYWLDLSMNWTVFAFLLGICCVAALLAGVAPALHISTASSKRPQRWTSALTIVQLAVALVLVSTAAVLWRSGSALDQQGARFDTSNAFTMRLALPEEKYLTAAARRAFLERLDDSLARDASVESATVASNIPFLPGGIRRRLLFGGESGARDSAPLVAYIAIGPRYFDTLRLRLLRGRPFMSSDAGDTAERAAIVNQQFVTMFAHGRDPIGLRFELADTSASQAEATSFVVVGIAPTIPQFARLPGLPPQTLSPVVYAPLGADPQPGRVASIIARGRAPMARTVPAIQDEVRRLDPDLPLYFVQPLDAAVEEMSFQIYALASLIGVIAVIALVLAIVGLYAVTAHAVTARTSEIGIRVALGARTREVVWLFVRRAAAYIALALCIGFAGTLALGRVLVSIVAQISPHDPVTLASVAAVLVAVALVASIVPARKAGRLDPARTLRFE